MSRPVVSTIMHDAGWTREEFDTRDTLILQAAMEAFPTRDSWCTESSDRARSEALVAAMRPVAVRFNELGNNGWYTHNEKKARNYFQGLHYALVQWARGQMSYRRAHFSGWWTSKGVKVDTISPPDRKLIVKLRVGSSISSSTNRSETSSTRENAASHNRSISTPLPTQTISEVEDDRILLDDVPTNEQQPPRTHSVTKYVSKDHSIDMTYIDTHQATKIQGRDTNSHSTKSMPSTPTPPLETQTQTDVDWTKMVIKIDATSVDKGTLWLMMRFLVPDGNDNSSWEDFEYQKFLNELIEVTSSHKLEQCQHDLIYMDGERKHPIANKHDYSIMLWKFSTTRLPSQNMLELTLQRRGEDPKGIKIEPLVIDMTAFQPPASTTENENENTHANQNRTAENSTNTVPQAGKLSERTLSNIEALALPLRSDVIDPALQRNRRGLASRKRTATAKQLALNENKLMARGGETGSTGERPSKRRA